MNIPDAIELVEAINTLAVKAKNYDALKKNYELRVSELEREVSEHKIAKSKLREALGINSLLTRHLNLLRSISEMDVCPDCDGLGAIEYDIETEFGSQLCGDNCNRCEQSGLVPKDSIIEPQYPVEQLTTTWESAKNDQDDELGF